MGLSNHERSVVQERDAGRCNDNARKDRNGAEDPVEPIAELGKVAPDDN